MSFPSISAFPNPFGCFIIHIFSHYSVFFAPFRNLDSQGCFSIHNFRILSAFLNHFRNPNRHMAGWYPRLQERASR